MGDGALDLLVLGSGVAGLSAAVRAAAEPGMQVGVLTKGELSQAATRWAQGGVAAVLGGDPDSTDLHLADTLSAGAGLCDVDAVRVLVDEGPARVNELIAMGAMTGPRMFVAGQGISAGRGWTPDPAAMAKNAEDRIKAGSDWVKVYGSRGSFDSVETTQTITFDEMKAIVDAAHALGHKVAIHSYGPSGVKDAVRAGADSIEHGIELDDETLAEMVRRGTVWVPTIDHNRYYVDAKDEFGFKPEAIPPLQD